MVEKERKNKFIFVTGGVVSSLGKGLSAACIGALLEARGLKVSLSKLDPYINVDPGTMNPFQHGEVFVTDDGAETDLDLGHYERFTNARLSRRNNCTTGQVYETVIRKERQGKYLGETIQVIPHITDEIKNRIREAAGKTDIAIIEIGGTVGDIESLPFMEAIRQFQFDVGPEHCCYVHVTLVPYINAAGELKTKPTQHSVNKLQEIGIRPDILICRTEQPLDMKLKNKIALFCNVRASRVVSAEDAATIYEVPLMLHKQGLDSQVVDVLGIWTGEPKLSQWEKISARVKDPKDVVKIAIVGKYIDLTESYKSLNEALAHGGIGNNCRVNLKFVDSEKIEEGASLKELLGDCNGILVPGGFGQRGTEGKIKAIQYAREKKIPYFGICLGMQLATVEFARNVAGLKGANSTEFDSETAHPVILLMQEQEYIRQLGGTMRLGAWSCSLKNSTQAMRAYGTSEISERHRHRYEFNNDYREKLCKKGLRLTGLTPDGLLVEVIELDRKKHPWFLGCQFHPEFKSRPWEPHPLFQEFIRAAKSYKKGAPSVKKPAQKTAAKKSAKRKTKSAAKRK
ncbi:MAG: CTP synthase [bacterium]